MINASPDTSVIQEPLNANWQEGEEGLQGSLGSDMYVLVHQGVSCEVSNKTQGHFGH